MWNFKIPGRVGNQNIIKIVYLTSNIAVIPRELGRALTRVKTWNEGKQELNPNLLYHQLATSLCFHQSSSINSNSKVIFNAKLVSYIARIKHLSLTASSSLTYISTFRQPVNQFQPNSAQSTLGSSNEIRNHEGMCLSLTRDNSKIVKIHNLLGQFQPTLAQRIP